MNKKILILIGSITTAIATIFACNNITNKNILETKAEPLTDIYSNSYYHFKDNPFETTTGRITAQVYFADLEDTGNIIKINNVTNEFNIIEIEKIQSSHIQQNHIRLVNTEEETTLTIYENDTWVDENYKTILIKNNVSSISTENPTEIQNFFNYAIEKTQVYTLENPDDAIYTNKVEWDNFPQSNKNQPNYIELYQNNNLVTTIQITYPKTTWNATTYGTGFTYRIKTTENSYFPASYSTITTFRQQDDRIYKGKIPIANAYIGYENTLYFQNIDPHADKINIFKKVNNRYTKIAEINPQEQNYFKVEEQNYGEIAWAMIDTTQEYENSDYSTSIEVNQSTYRQYTDIDQYEVIDLGGLMLQILSMPWTFISKAFDVTIFPNTPYAINFSNIFKGLIAILTLLFIIRLFTNGFSAIGNIASNTEDRKWQKEQRQMTREKHKMAKEKHEKDMKE